MRQESGELCVFGFWNFVSDDKKSQLLFKE